MEGGVSKMVKAPRLFGTNGIRGVAGREIDSGLAFRVGSALGTLFPKGRVLIGRDGRLSSSMLLEGVAAGLVAPGGGGGGGGFVLSPAFGFIVKKKSSFSGEMIDDSNKPPPQKTIKEVDSY